MVLRKLAGRVAATAMLSALVGLLLFACEGAASAAGAVPLPEESAGGSGGRAEEAPEGAQGPARGRALRRRLLYFFFYAAFIVGAVVATPQLLSLALDAGHPVATVSGSSMWPTLKKGDLVVVKGVDSIDDLSVGDIIAFQHQEGLAVHRIVRFEGEAIVTKGDANVEEDPPIDIRQVAGKIPFVAGRPAKLPLLGYLSLLMGPLIGPATSIIGEDDAWEDGGSGNWTVPVREYDGPGGRPLIDSASSGEEAILGPVKDLAGEEAGESSPEGATLGEVTDQEGKQSDSPSQPSRTIGPVKDLNR